MSSVKGSITDDTVCLPLKVLSAIVEALGLLICYSIIDILEDTLLMSDVPYPSLGNKMRPTKTSFYQPETQG